MKKARFILSILLPWLLLWIITLGWIFRPNHEEINIYKYDLLNSLRNLDNTINDLDDLLATSHVEAQIIVLDENTDHDLVQLGQLINKLANSSNSINERVLTERQNLNKLWHKSGIDDNGLTSRINTQYSNSIKYTDEYISYLTEIINIINDDSDDNNFAIVLTEMNKTIARNHLSLKQIRARIHVIQNKQRLVDQYNLNKAKNERPWLFIIISNLIYLLTLVYLLYRWHKYSNNYHRLTDNVNNNQELVDKVTVMEKQQAKMEAHNQRLNNELALTRLYYENIANNIRLGMLMIAEDKQLISFNSTAANILKIQNDDKNKQLKELSWWCKLELVKELENAINDAINKRETKKMDAVILNNGRHKNFLDLVISPYISATGQVHGVTILIDDVTANVAMRSHLQENERLATVGRLAAQVAHEIRNPLSSISLNSELLQDELAENGSQEERQALLKAIQKEINRLTEVTENYLNMARAPKARLETIDLNQFIEDTLSFYRAELTSHNVKTELRLAAEKIMVAVDQGQIRQAVLNIIKNSIEAMPDGGLLTISTKIAGEKAILLLSDNGPGVEEADRQAIFDPFYTTKNSGNGMGLAISSQLIKDNGGSIIYKDIEGCGASFEITFG